MCLCVFSRFRAIIRTAPTGLTPPCNMPQLPQCISISKRVVPGDVALTVRSFLPGSDTLSCWDTTPTMHRGGFQRDAPVGGGCWQGCQQPAANCIHPSFVSRAAEAFFSPSSCYLSGAVSLSNPQFRVRRPTARTRAHPLAPCTAENVLAAPRNNPRRG